MGHATPTVQSRYRHQLPGQLEEDARRLEEYLRGAIAGKVLSIGYVNSAGDRLRYGELMSEEKSR